MDRDSVWQILRGYIQPPKGTDLALEIEDWQAGLGMAADAIAQAHRREMDELEHRYRQGNQMDLDIAGMAVIDMRAAQAQAAGLADLLTEFAAKPELEGRDGWQDDEFGIHCAHCDAATESFLENIEHDDDCPILRTRAALKDTPQVLWSGEVAITVEDDWVIFDPVSGGGPMLVEGAFPVEMHGKLGDAIILAHSEGCLPKGKQGQESGQEE